MYVVIHKETNSIEWCVDSKEDFKRWLKEYNKERVESGEVPEEEWEFELVNIEKIY